MVDSIIYVLNYYQTVICKAIRYIKRYNILYLSDVYIYTTLNHSLNYQNVVSDIIWIALSFVAVPNFDPGYEMSSV